MTGADPAADSPQARHELPEPGGIKVRRQKLGYSTVMSPVMPAQSWSAHHIS
jgi:hypothetical protein